MFGRNQSGAGSFLSCPTSCCRLQAERLQPERHYDPGSAWMNKLNQQNHRRVLVSLLVELGSHGSASDPVQTQIQLQDEIITTENKLL